MEVVQISKKKHDSLLKELELNKQLLEEEARSKGILRSEVEQLQSAVQSLNSRLLEQIKRQEDRISNDRILTEQNLHQDELKQCIVELRILLKSEREKNERLQNQLLETAQELEEVTRSLFEEANQMVSDEARRRAGVEEEMIRLKEKMEEMGRRCEMESIQNQNLKERLRNSTLPLDKTKELKSHSSSETIHSANSVLIHQKMKRNLVPRRTSSTPSLNSHLMEESYYSSGDSSEGDGCDEGDHKDKDHEEEEREEIPIPNEFPPSTLKEFSDFIADVNSEELLSGPFGEKIMEGEVSPTLRFFCNKKNYSKLLSPRSGVFYLSSWKNLEKALAENRCYVESIGNVQDKSMCSCCERRESQFKMRIQIPTHLLFNPNDSYAWSDWKFICSTCRERLISVGDLYTFIRNAKSGFLKKDLVSLYRQFLKLRIRMSASRVLTM